MDDEHDISLSIENGLTNNGFEVDAYNDPKKALVDFKPNVYDLLLIDLRMPEINGFELYHEIKKIQVNAKVCFLSANEMYYDQFRQIFPTTNVLCFIRKPLGLHDLISHVKRELRLD